MQADLFKHASAIAASGIPKEHADRILKYLTGIPSARDRDLPIKWIVSTRQCPRRSDVLIAELVMFDDKPAELKVFENGMIDGEVVWGGFWSYVPEGFPLLRDGEWRRGDPKAYGVTYGIVFHEIDGAAEDNWFVGATWSAEEIANTLVCCCPELEGRDPEDVLPHVQEWLRQRGTSARSFP
ncbi:hypothetical protein ACVWZK_003092 [Bradyrhizobium sp. GM0.4]